MNLFSKACFGERKDKIVFIVVFNLEIRIGVQKSAFNKIRNKTVYQSLFSNLVNTKPEVCVLHFF
jgi:hypothetical protein